MLSKPELGLYSLAVIISEMIYFVPMAVTNGMYPKYVKAEKNGNLNALLVKIGSVNWIICFIFVLGCIFFISFFVKFFYGYEYIRIGSVITIHSLASIFVALGVSHSPLLIFKNLQKYSLYASLIGAILNVILNYFMISKWGINGAAIATVITQAFASYLFFAFVKDKTFFLNETRSLFFRFNKT
jgi:O-antigen/teichoic acid export membrane protein